MKIIMLGPPNSGKGSYALRLSPILGVPSISTGDLCREEVARGTELGKKIKEIMNKGGLQPDEVIIKMLDNRLKKEDCKKGFILDGYPRTLKQAGDLEKITKIDYVLNLVVPKWILFKRASLRETCEKCGEIYNLGYLKPKREGICDKCGGKLIQRDDDKEVAVKKRFQEYEEKTRPLVEFYKKKGILLNVSNNKIDTPPEIVVNKILDMLGVKK